ncbi:hypothetical protein CDAR_198111 [Caerostris darwini]|uniref:Uncharacterized protein n=1 Tax=Caerostris darwini TaxID=1538125 RepID=A0AAV4RH65_9ARAC|nr:hypothetical protein CDAR_198111 [Caerostris darwini]
MPFTKESVAGLKEEDGNAEENKRALGPVYVEYQAASGLYAKVFIDRTTKLNLERPAHKKHICVTYLRRNRERTRQDKQMNKRRAESKGEK